jgi:hypothetical protein
MIQITYAPPESHLAQQIQTDLADSSLQPEKNLLLVLVSSASNADDTVQQEIADALANNTVEVVPVRVDDVELPPALANHPRVLDLSDGYDSSRLLRHIRRVDVGQAIKKSNNRLLFYLLAAALLIFVISLGAIGSGQVRAPNDEFATENALRDATIRAITNPTVEALLPRGTDESQSFDATLRALDNDDLVPVLAGTASAIPRDRQATQQARETAAAATSTARAEGTAQATDN